MSALSPNLIADLFSVFALINNELLDFSGIKEYFVKTIKCHDPKLSNFEEMKKIMNDFIVILEPFDACYSIAAKNAFDEVYMK